MDLPALAATVFLIAVVPIAIFVSFSDLARMKIPNVAVGALLLSFAVLGLFVLPFEQYLWHWSHFIVLLVVGIILNAAGVMGAGDAKFIAAAGPMIATTDASLVAILFAAALLGGFAAHRLAKHTYIRQAVPHWESWTAGKRFPMGFPLSMTLVGYLAVIAATRS